MPDQQKMNGNDSTRFHDNIREGWRPHRETRKYVCGWCGCSVSTSVGLCKAEEWYAPSAPPWHRQRRSSNIRACPECWYATTFVGEKHQLPAPRLGENLDASDKSDDVNMIVALYDEARIALSQDASSCAVLMFRKLLMHIAVEQGAKEDLRFVDYVKHLKNENVVGRPQHALVDRIKDDGNEENHEITRASPEHAKDLLNLVTLLIQSVYFSD